MSRSPSESPRPPARPWWQQRLSTARRTAGFAVVAVLLAAAFLLMAWHEVSQGRPSAFGVVVAVVWTGFAAAFVAGAVAQRREEPGR